jgi:molecular chaperone DnaK
MGRTIGIDLGTTKSCVAVIEDGVPVVIANSEGRRTTPSIVGFTSIGTPVVGAPAKNQMINNSENTVYSIMRLMGQSYSEVGDDLGFIPYRVIHHGDEIWIDVLGRSYSPEEVSAFIIEKMKKTAEDYLGETVLEAVIAVPAHFNNAQRQALKDAGRIAGLEVKRIINDGAATSLAYGFNRVQEKVTTIAVYDLGGGAFDLSILEICDGVFEVKSINGDSHLGGDDFDRRIMEWLLADFKKDCGIDLYKDRLALPRLKDAAERAKIELSSVQQAEIYLPFITADAHGPRHLQNILTLSAFERMIDDLLDRSMTICSKVLADAELAVAQIDEVILGGGSTRIPKVQQIVRDLFGKEPSKAVNPDEAVAVGAAILCGILEGDIKGILLLDTTPHSLGIETVDGVCVTIIPRFTSIPCRKSQKFSMAADGQTEASIHILEGESKLANQNRTISRFFLKGIPAAPHSFLQIEIYFDIDANSTLLVSVKDLNTDKELQTSIESSNRHNETNIGFSGKAKQGLVLQSPAP